MNRLAIASLFSVISLAREQRERASLSQLLMLHDELVNHLDPDANEADPNLFERFWGSEKDNKKEEVDDKEDRRGDKQERRGDKKDEKMDRREGRRQSRQKKIVPEKIRAGAVKASQVCVNNSAGFVLNFYFDNLISGDKSASTDDYPIDQYKCLSIADALPETTEGDIIMTYVKAIAGVTNSVETAIKYDSTAQTATFTCKGTTLSYSCELNGDGKSESKEDKRDERKDRGQDRKDERMDRREDRRDEKMEREEDRKDERLDRREDRRDERMERD